MSESRTLDEVIGLLDEAHAKLAHLTLSSSVVDAMVSISDAIEVIEDVLHATEVRRVG